MTSEKTPASFIVLPSGRDNLTGQLGSSAPREGTVSSPRTPVDERTFLTLPPLPPDPRSPPATHPMTNKMLGVCVALAALAHGVSGQAICTIAMLQDVHDILPICCGGTASPENCASGMPARCAPECADLLVPFWATCSSLMQFMGNDALGFDLHAVSDFIEPCQQTLALVSAGAESCDAGTGRGGPDDLHSWVDDVNSACCMQSGINVCRDGSAVPWVCNADCKLCPAATLPRTTPLSARG